MENKNIFNNILAAMEREGVKITIDKGLEDMTDMLSRCPEIDSKTMNVFLRRMGNWLENEYGIMISTYNTKSGAWAYQIIGFQDKRILRYCSQERAMAGGIIRGIEMINESDYETKNN